MGSIYQHSRLITGGIGIHLLLLTAAVALSACGGGGGTPASSPPVNRVPTVSAGADQSVAEMTVVNLNGSGSDPDAGDTLTFAWTQTAGQSVTINNASTANADFMAPDVAAGAPEVLTFRLSVNDGNGGNATDTVDVTVQELQAMVTISGKVQYEFVPANANCNGLNFNGTIPRPIRQATVQILDATTETVIDTIASNDFGDYSFTVVANTMLFLRVRTELKRAGPSSSWDVEVRDNVVDPLDPSPPLLAQRPLYVLDGADFDSGTLDMTRNLTATTGWDDASSSYTGVRAAAPFAVLDAIYAAMSAVVAADPVANFAPLDAFWSVNNTSATLNGADIDSGEIGGSFYRRNIDSLFLLGMENDDTEEFDDHVVVHEWGHYFEDNFSRSDSIGGAHSLGQALDMRVAFGEGFATAMSGIGLDDPIYCDTGGAGQASRFLRIDIENDGFGVEGWYNEISVTNLIYDLWDTHPDGMVNDSLGFGPIYDVMTIDQRITPAFTSIFSFATELKALMQIQDPTKVAFIDTILNDRSITAANIDVYGSNEANDGPGTPLDVLPIYTNVPISATFQICSNSQFDNGRDGNKLSEYRYLILDVDPPSPLTFTIDNANPPSQPSAGFDCTADPDDPENRQHSDPDIGIYQNGTFVGGGFSCQPNSEVTTLPGLSGRYVLDVVEFRYLDDESPVGFPEQTCFDITITP